MIENRAETGTRRRPHSDSAAINEMMKGPLSKEACSMAEGFLRPLPRIALLTLAIIAAYPATGSAQPGAEHLFHDKAAGIYVEKPATWHYATPEELEGSPGYVKLDNPALQKALEESSKPPVVAILRYPEPYLGLNPTFAVSVDRVKDGEKVDPALVLRLIMPIYHIAHQDLRVESPIKATKAAGLEGAEVGLRYAMNTVDGGRFPTRTRLVLLSAGDVFYLITMSGPPHGLADPTPHFEKILKTLRLGSSAR